MIFLNSLSDFGSFSAKSGIARFLIFFSALWQLADKKIDAKLKMTVIFEYFIGFITRLVFVPYLARNLYMSPSLAGKGG
jgi:hypothetical protein